MDVRVVERDFFPICPYCESELDEIVEIKRGWWIFRMVSVYCCPYCCKILGTGFRA